MDSGYDRPYIPILIAFRAGMAAIDWARRNQEGEWRRYEHEREIGVETWINS